jgi:hypothetical protein
MTNTEEKKVVITEPMKRHFVKEMAKMYPKGATITPAKKAPVKMAAPKKK